MRDAAALALVHFLWQGAALALVAAVLMRVARRSAQARYAIGVATLCAMAAAPAITTAWLFQAPGTMVIVDGPVTVSAAGTVLEADRFVISGVTSSEAPDASGFPYTTIVLIAWAIGVLVLCARLAGGWLIAHRLATRAVTPVVEEVQQTARRLAARLKLSRPVRILESSFVAVPLMIGWLKPVVLLPTAAIAGLAPDQLEALIAHELAHVRRHDYLVNLLQSLAETLLFYHPAVWWMSHRVREDREHCCDDLAVGVTDRLTYVTALSHVASLTAPGVALAATDGSLRGRVRRLLGPERDRRSGGAWLAILPLVLVIATVSPIAGRAAAEIPQPPAPVISIEPSSPPAVQPLTVGERVGQDVKEPLRGLLSPAPDPAPPLPLPLSADMIIAVGAVSLAQAPPAPVPQAPAQVKPGETIVINVEGRPELSGTYVVQPDGTINLKGVEPEAIEVQVGGAVRTPGVVRLPGSIRSVARAIIQAGGFTPNAGAEVEIFRRHPDGRVEVITVTREQLDMNEDPGLHAGDRVNVKVGRVFFVNGEVLRKGERPWGPGMTVNKAIVLSGGSTDKFSLARSYIQRPVRNPDGQMLKYEKISDLKLDTPILPDDTFVAGRKLM